MRLMSFKFVLIRILSAPDSNDFFAKSKLFIFPPTVIGIKKFEETFLIKSKKLFSTSLSRDTFRIISSSIAL